jgi:hypothetical protein
MVYIVIENGINGYDYMIDTFTCVVTYSIHTYIYIYTYVNISKKICEKYLVATSSFDRWLTNTEEVSVKINFILTPESR